MQRILYLIHGSINFGEDINSFMYLEKIKKLFNDLYKNISMILKKLFKFI